jgi:hypothetical protein
METSAQTFGAGLSSARCVRHPGLTATGRNDSLAHMGERRGHEPASGLSRRERSMLGRISQFLGVADVMALLMVAATAFSAIATWRTADIATALYMAAERPYLGVEQVRLDRSRAGDPRVVVEYHNFGSLSADDVVITGRLAVDGRTLTGQKWTKNAGIVSPSVPHFLLFHGPPQVYPAVMSGRSKFVVEVEATYSGAASSRLCYLERFVYLSDSDTFDVDGGTSRCEHRSLAD